MWFRVELNRDGSVIKAEHVESKLPGAGRFVVYIDADSKELAMASAVDRYRRYLEKQRGDIRERRAARKAAGRCRDCGRPSASGIRCKRCAERNNAFSRNAKGFGVQVPKPIPVGSRSQRAIILSEILEAAVSMKAGVAFISWLRAERDAAVGGKAQAAE